MSGIKNSSANTGRVGFFRFRDISSLWVYCNKIPIDPIFHLLNWACKDWGSGLMVLVLRFRFLHFPSGSPEVGSG